MAPGFKIAILAGVSRDIQAGEDKASIPDQLKVCREFIHDTGGAEIDAYIMDGYSRTGYDSLQDAMNDIPPLKRAIEDMMAGRYNILLLDNWDRLGDLGQLVHTRFRRYKKQLHSVRQSGRLQDPDTYNPALDESGVIDMSIQRIIQSYRVNKLQRGFQLGIAKRTDDGNYSTAYPGAVYKKVMITDKEWQLERREPNATILVQMKDLLLRGASLGDLEKFGAEMGTVGRKGGPWRQSTIHKMLVNPFMAGKVFKDRYQNVGWHVGKSGKRVYDKKKNSDPELKDGNHPALWTFEEYKRILEELYMRQHLIPKKNKFTLSGLLICGICGKRINVISKGKYRCPTRHPGVKPVARDVMVDRVAPALVAALKDYTGEQEEQRRVSNIPEAIAAIDAQIAKIHHGYEIGIYNDQQAKDRTDKLKAQRQALILSEQSEQDRKERDRRIVAVREELGPILDDIPRMLTDKEKRNEKENNLFLMRFIKGIVVRGKDDFEFLWR